MRYALQTVTPPALVSIGSSAADGPLVSGLNGIEAAALALTNPAQLALYINGPLQAAEAALPEGAWVQVSITGWDTPLGSGAQFIASQLQAAYAAGKIVDPSTGQPPEAWPTANGVVFTGDDASDTVVIRALKAQPPQVVIWILVGLAAVVAVALVWHALSGASWSAQASAAGAVLSWAARNWPLLLGAGLLLGLAPLAIREVGRLESAEASLASGRAALRRAREAA